MGPRDRWAVILAIKALPSAKSRMVDLTVNERSDLALAMARDVVAASLSCPLVDSCAVVTSDPRVSATMAAAGARVVAQPRDNGLDGAFLAGIGATSHVTTGSGGVALLMADLPFVTGEDLERALLEVPAHRPAVVADADGTGTTMLAARHPAHLRPAFGGRSFERHLAGGAVDLTPFAGPGLRRDVDELPAFRACVAPGTATRVWMDDWAPGVGLAPEEARSLA